jgi:hypothetical protein
VGQQFAIQSIVRQIPLRDAQRDASAGPVSKKGQAFGLAFFAATRAHSAFLRAMAVPAVVGEFFGNCEGLYTKNKVIAEAPRPPTKKGGSLTVCPPREFL